jgi:hypothetical protein
MNQASLPRAAAGRTLVLSALLLVAAAGAGADETGFILDLPDGGRLPGRFTEATESDGPRLTLGWRSPQFAGPFEFWLDEIVGVRATGGAAAAPEPRGFSCHLRGGDIIDGELQVIDDRQVVILPLAEEPLRIDRGLVKAITRKRPGVGTGYIGPEGLAGWTRSPESAWREEAGRIVGDVPRGSLTRDVAGPPRARYDIVLSWRERPELSLAVAAGDGKSPDPYRFEMHSTGPAGPVAILVRQDATAGMLEPVDLPGAVSGRLELSLFVDQAVGRLAAAVKGGPDVVDLTVLPQGDRGPSGRFRLQISSGDVRLEQLRVSPWQTAEPVMGDPDMTRVALRGGRALAGDVVSLDAAGDLVVRGAAPGECEPGQLASRRGLKAG